MWRRGLGSLAVVGASLVDCSRFDSAPLGQIDGGAPDGGLEGGSVAATEGSARGAQWLVWVGGKGTDAGSGLEPKADIYLLPIDQGAGAMQWKIATAKVPTRSREVHQVTAIGNTLWLFDHDVVFRAELTDGDIVTFSPSQTYDSSETMNMDGACPFRLGDSMIVPLSATNVAVGRIQQGTVARWYTAPIAFSEDAGSSFALGHTSDRILAIGPTGEAYAASIPNEDTVGAWTPLLSGGRAGVKNGHLAPLVFDPAGQLHMVGVGGETGEVAAARVVNGTLDPWRSGASMGTARLIHSAALAGNRLYAAGGHEATSGVVQGSVEVAAVDPTGVAGPFSGDAIPPLPSPRQGYCRLAVLTDP